MESGTSWIEGGFIERSPAETDIAMLELYLSRPDALVTVAYVFPAVRAYPGLGCRAFATTCQ